MMTCLFCTGPVTVNAVQDEVTYAVYSWNDTKRTLSHTDKTVTDYTEVTSQYLQDHSYILEGSTGTAENKVFVVKQNLKADQRITIKKGTRVDLVVLKNVTLTCNQGILYKNKVGGRQRCCPPIL